MLRKVKPVITETTIDLAKKSWYTFGVPKEKNKNEIKKFIERNFKVNVLSIKTLIVKGKVKRSLKGQRIRKGPDWKKVMVRLKEGQKIDLFETGG